MDEWAEREIFEESYVPEKIVYATVEEDICIAAFFIAMLDGYSVEEFLHLATARGAY